MWRTGTAHFVSKAKAVQYYRDYEGNNAKEAVERKLAAREIAIGPPALPANGRLLIIDNGTRYAIEE